MTVPPILLLLPGLLCDARLWRDQVDALRDEIQVIIADLTQDDNMPGMAARALAAVPENAPIALAGLSMGGHVAFEIMRQAPRRIARLALMDTSARGDTAEQARRRRAQLALSKSGMFHGVTPRLLPQLLHPRHIGGPLGQEVIAMAERLGRDVFHRQQQAILARPDSRPGLAAIAVPTMILVGEADTRTPPKLAEEMAAAIPHATLHRIPEAGHLPPMEEPALVTAFMRAWLAAPA